MMRKTLGVLAAVAVLALGLPMAAHAVTVTMGNPTIDRLRVDTFQNFTLVDTNSPAAFDGYFTEIHYFAEQAGAVRFVVVDAASDVTWISDEVTLPQGEGVLTLAAPVTVSAGSNIGVYSAGPATVSFDSGATESAGSPARWTGHNSGVPELGDTIPDSPLDSTSRYRTYSMNAPIHAISKDICKDGGWKDFGYKNQGQCIASIVASPNSVHGKG